MAAWQFDLYIVSESQVIAARDKEPGPPQLPLPLVYDFQAELAHYLGPPWRMLNDWLVFGPENGNRVDIVFESDTNASVSVRCDVREEAPQFLVLVSDLARFHGCLFFDPASGEIIEPDLELLLEIIRRSQS